MTDFSPWPFSKEVYQSVLVVDGKHVVAFGATGDGKRLLRHLSQGIKQSACIYAELTFALHGLQLQVGAYAALTIAAHHGKLVIFYLAKNIAQDRHWVLTVNYFGDQDGCAQHRGTANCKFHNFVYLCYLLRSAANTGSSSMSVLESDVPPVLVGILPLAVL